MFVRDIDLALQRAEAGYAPEIWQSMSANERSAAIYRELRALDAQSVKHGNSCSVAAVPAPRRSATYTAFPTTLIPLALGTMPST